MGCCSFGCLDVDFILIVCDLYCLLIVLLDMFSFLFVSNDLNYAFVSCVICLCLILPG